MLQQARRGLNQWYLNSMASSLWRLNYSTQQEVNAYMIPAEVAAMVSTATDDSYKQVPSALVDITKQLVGGDVKGRMRRLRRESQQLTQRLKRLSRTAGRGGTLVVDKDSRGQLPVEKEDALARRFLRQLPIMPSLDTDTDVEAQLQYHLDEKGNAASRAKLRATQHPERSCLKRRGANLAPDYTDQQVAAYLASRFAGCYSSAFAVLDQLRWRMGDWAPVTMMDFGAGPGTLVWAAAEVWPGKFERVVAVEPAPKMTTAGYNIYHLLLQQQKEASAGQVTFPVPPIRWVYHLPASRGAQARTSIPQYDLVTAGYVLGEIDSQGLRTKIVADLWERTASNGLLVLIEPGTPAGTEAILAARAQVLSLAGNGSIEGSSAYVVAPCPHDGACPMQGTKGWCHFVQRFQRPELHRQLKLQPGQAGPRIYQDERYAYVAIRKAPRPAAEHYTLVTPDLVLEDVRGPRAWSDSESDYESSESDGEFDEANEERWGKPAQSDLQQQEQQHQSLLMQQLAKAKALVAKRKGITLAIDSSEQTPSPQADTPESDVVEALIRASIRSSTRDETTADILADPELLYRWKSPQPPPSATPSQPAADTEQSAVESTAAVQVHDLCEPAVEPEESDTDDEVEGLSLREIFSDALDVALQDCNQWSRIIRQPRKRKGHIMVDLCTAQWAPLGRTDTSQGKLIRQIVRRRDKLGNIGPAGYRLARKAVWGDLWPMHYQRTGKIAMSKGPLPSATPTTAAQSAEEMQTAKELRIALPNNMPSQHQVQL